MSIQDNYEEQLSIIKWIDENLSGSYSTPEEKDSLAHAAFDLVTELHASICLLCHSKFYGSMLVLMRAQFETLIRGIWLRHSASENEINSFRKDRVKMSFGDMIKAVEKSINLEKALFSQLKQRQWDMFNSFAHSGYQAIIRRVNTTHTGYVAYKEDEIVTVLRQSGIFSILAACELSEMIENVSIKSGVVVLAENYGRGWSQESE